MFKSLRFSDLILESGGRAYMKSRGELITCSREQKRAIRSLLGEVVKIYEDTKKPVFRIQHEDVGYRVALYEGVEWGAGLVWFLRRIPEKVPALDTLGLSDSLVTWLMAHEQRKGLILFSGAQASGKTTSASAYIAERLKRFGGLAVSFETPVEMPLCGPHGEHGVCYQANTDEENLAQAIERSHLCASPDIIYIGEIRNKYAASEALRVSLGSDDQIVVATIHGLDVPAALDRLSTFAREIDGEVAASNLSQSLLAIIQQQLVSAPEGDRVLHVPGFLLVPHSPKYAGIRAKLKTSEFATLREDMREQLNIITYKGIDAI